ncbi:hypothetical protein BD410DRAFT_622369 [Rickenella mellea]|uniref:MYND-type domain-containing protein n=1 Tax=Rickenella mellea TaxID=50990 RepID=A0A4Y7PPI9_9AGAM|nr:hypothetical protein BD410DRAFT_622369 [Rickenella mellea]
MNRRMGMESIMGIGGGKISQASQAALDKAEELCRKRKPEQALPYLTKAMEDSNNLDAFIQAAFLLPLPDAVRFLEKVERKGRAALKQSLSADCFEESGRHYGQFWGLIETRPYMRVLQAMVRLYFENKNYAKSADTAVAMLRLCPGDNMGQRDWLGSLLLQSGRISDALFFAQAWLTPDAFGKGIPPPSGGTAFGAPSKEPLSSARENELAEYSDSSVVYTAAFAAFKLWGNCPLACQYLRIGASVNPHIIIKILAKSDPPRSLNMDARSFNGPEVAQDYLWLTQVLWMESDIWAWANDDTIAKRSVLRNCCLSPCGKLESRVMEWKRCAACKEVWYCSGQCQKVDWPVHKPRCLQHKKNKQYMRALSRGAPLPPDFNTPVATADFSGQTAFMKTPTG